MKNNQTLIWKSYLSSFAEKGTWTLLSNSISRIVLFRGNWHSKYHTVTLSDKHLFSNFLWRWRWVMLPKWSLPPEDSFWFEDDHLSTLSLPCGEGANRSFVSSVKIRRLSATLWPHVNPVTFQRPYLSNMFTLRVRAPSVNLGDTVYEAVTTQTCKEQHYS